MFKYRVSFVIIESRLEYRASFALARYNIVYRWSLSCVDRRTRRTTFYVALTGFRIELINEYEIYWNLMHDSQVILDSELINTHVFRKTGGQSKHVKGY